VNREQLGLNIFLKVFPSLASGAGYLQRRRKRESRKENSPLVKKNIKSETPVHIYAIFYH